MKKIVLIVICGICMVGPAYSETPPSVMNASMDESVLGSGPMKATFLKRLEQKFAAGKACQIG